MTEPQFQAFLCINPACDLRLPTDLSVDCLDKCPRCGSGMVKSGYPYTNYHPHSDAREKTDIHLNILLDNLRSSLNVGSIFRSADCAGVSHIYCCGTTPTPEQARVKKTSLGAEDTVSWSYHPNSISIAKKLIRDCHNLVSFEYTPDSVSLLDVSLAESANNHRTLIFGNEVSGIDPVILELSDQTIHLPLFGTKSSINVAVVAGVALYFYIAALRKNGQTITD